MVTVSKGDLLNMLGVVTGIGAGIGAWLKESTKKDPGTTLEGSFANALAHMFGQKISFTITGIPVTAGFSFNPKGAFNATSITGAGLLIADAILAEHFKVPGYEKVRKFIVNAGLGTLIGGVIGGLFDPDDGLTPGQIARLPSSNEVNVLAVRTGAVI